MSNDNDDEQEPADDVVVWEGEMWSTMRRETVQVHVMRLARGEHCPHGNLAGCTDRCPPCLEDRGYRIEKMVTRIDESGNIKEQWERAELNEFPAMEWAMALVRKSEGDVWG